MDESDPIPISALQLHLEQAFAENVHTLRGRAVHAAVDTPGLEMRAGCRRRQRIVRVRRRDLEG